MDHWLMAMQTQECAGRSAAAALRFSPRNPAAQLLGSLFIILLRDLTYMSNHSLLGAPSSVSTTMELDIQSFKC
jgi:hypothetical protein